MAPRRPSDAARARNSFPPEFVQQSEDCRSITPREWEVLRVYLATLNDKEVARWALVRRLSEITLRPSSANLEYEADPS